MWIYDGGYKCSYYVDRMSFAVCEYCEHPSEKKVLQVNEDESQKFFEIRKFKKKSSTNGISEKWALQLQWCIALQKKSLR